MRVHGHEQHDSKRMGGEAEFRGWANDAEDYCDKHNKGFGEVVKQMKLFEDKITVDQVHDNIGLYSDIETFVDGAELHFMLKRLTTGKAKDLMNSAPKREQMGGHQGTMTTICQTN